MSTNLKASRTRLARQRWYREHIVSAIDAWVELYGQPPAAADWNPALARRQGRPHLAERHAAGAWPSYSTVVAYFGSWSAAIEAAGWPSRPRGGRVAPLTGEQREILADAGLVPVYGEDGRGHHSAVTWRRHRLQSA